ncbi:MAG: J domain-containing protein, partial [Gemmatimonadetes bacterium]|nr:J domain-containing protein [Gemmatimonadota bacterium]
MDPRERHLSTLGLGPDASLEDIKRAYRELTKRWHPDRFAGEPALQAEATEELRRIVEAYRALTRPPAAEAPGPAVIVPSPAREPAPRARRHTRDAAASARTTASPPRRDAGAPARTPSPRRLLAARLTARAGILFPLALGLLILLRWPRPAGLGVLSGLLALGGLALGAWLLADRGGVRRLLGVGPVDGAATAALALVLFAGLAVLGRVAPYAFVAAEEAYPVYTWEGVGGGAPDAEPDAAPPAATRPEPPRRPTAAMRPRPADPAASAGRVADGDGVAAGRVASAGRVALAERVPSAAREAAPGRPPAAARPPASAASPRPADLAAAGPRAPARPEPAWRAPARAAAARPAPVPPAP